jgi:ornithine cyclodeaminase/thiomorpholine-carboxylate dehydrogenase
MNILMLSDEEVQRLLDPESLLDALAEGFTSLSDGRVVAPMRQEVTAQTGSFLIMPAWQPQTHAAVKMVSLFHDNHQLGLPAHQTLICLFDAQTGTPLAVMNGNSITALRTAGATALSVRLLARQEAHVLTILGTGVQGKAHVQVLPHIRDFREIRIASRHFAHAQQLAATIPQAHPVESFAEAVRGADVVCLCSSSGTPIISADWLSPGAHVTSVGFMPPGGELGRDAISQGRLFVETRLACEPPPVGCSELTGINPDLVTELGEVLLGWRPGRQSDQEITVYKAMGHAVEDLVTANLIYQRAKQQSIGQIVKL